MDRKPALGLGYTLFLVCWSGPNQPGLPAGLVSLGRRQPDQQNPSGHANTPLRQGACFYQSLGNPGSASLFFDGRFSNGRYHHDRIHPDAPSALDTGHAARDLYLGRHLCNGRDGPYLDLA